MVYEAAGPPASRRLRQLAQGTRVLPQPGRRDDVNPGPAHGTGVALRPPEEVFTMNRIFATLMALALLAVTQTAVHASHGEKVRQPLTSTGADPDASGLARLALKGASVGQFQVQVHKLDRKATFQVIVDDIPVADRVLRGGVGCNVRLHSEHCVE